jgi:hypothetical protein
MSPAARMAIAILAPSGASGRRRRAGGLEKELLIVESGTTGSEKQFC